MERVSDNLTLVSEKRLRELLKVEAEYNRMRAAVPKRIELMNLPKGMTIFGAYAWNACIDAYEKAMKGEG